MRTEAEPYVLLVKGGCPVADMYQARLEDEGFRVRQAADGAEALTVLMREPGQPALILTDLDLPRKSGYELCRRVAAIPELANIPVVVLSVVGDTTHLPRTEIIKRAFTDPPGVDDILGCVTRWAGEARRAA